MAENIPLSNQNASPGGNVPAETERTDETTQAEQLESADDDLLEEELEELVIEDFTIDGICGVY